MGQAVLSGPEMKGEVDIAIVGAGAVGLSTALALAERAPAARLAVLEREREVGAHQTGHNSGVVHSGVYYRPGSEKARLCVEGGRLLSAFCAERGLRLERCGKVIVATEERELPLLDELLARGAANGVPGLELIGPERLRRLEPNAAGLKALHSPHTGIVDFREVARKMAEEVRRRGARLLLGARLERLDRKGEALVASTPLGEVRTRYLVNCAGVYSDQVARLAGARPEVRIVPFRGEYFFLRPEARRLVQGLIYPVPDPRYPFLGVHLTRTVHGEVEAGPNAVLAFARDGYRLRDVHPAELLATLAFPGFWAMARRHWRTGAMELARSLRPSAFAQSLRRLVPALRREDLVRGGSGVRAQALEREGRLVDDFRFAQSERAVHVLNAPSPAATASLAIGRRVADLAAAAFRLGGASCQASSAGP